MNPWRPHGPELEEGKTFRVDSVIPESEQVRTEFYNDWMRPQGIAHPVVALLYKPDSGEPDSTFGAFRERSRGPFEDRDLDLIRRLIPHLQRAVAVHRRVQGAETRAGAAVEVLDRIAGGVILLDERGAAIATNLTADRILVMEDGLVMDRDGPSASTSKQTGELRRAVAGAAKTGASQGEDAGAVLRLVRPSGRQALEVVVTPIGCQASPLFDRRAAAAILVAEPDAQLDRPPERLCQLYGFTPLEAEVASRMVKGMDAAGISDDLGITIHTVRGHLKRLFAKTGTHRQSELIRVLLTGLASLRLE